MLIHFSQSSYFGANKGVDRYFIETYLLPGLVRQSVLAGGSKGVELPVGENQEPEYLSLEEAKSLVLDWLAQSQNLLESDKKKLERITNYKQFANLASNIYETQVKDLNKLATSARLQNIADLRAANKAGASTATAHFDPGKAIDDYNKMYLKLISSSRQGVSYSLLQKIVSGGIPSGNGNVSEASLAAVISSNLSRLYAAGSVGSSLDAQNFAVSKELGRIVATSYPEMTSILNILGDAQIASSLREITNRLAIDLETSTSLANYEKLQVAAITATDNYLLNQTELRAQILKTFSSMVPKDREDLTNALLAEIVSSARTPLTSVEIVERVSQKLNIPTRELATIQSALSNSGVAVSIEYRQNEISFKVNSRYLTAGERRLLSKGINPFLVHNSPEKLVSLESKLLAEYNQIPGHNKEFITLREAYAHEQQSINPKQSFLVQARSHFDQLDTYNDLSLSDKALIRRTRLGRWVADSRSRFYETQSKFFTKWGDIEDTITGKKFLNKLLDNWDAIAQNITIPGTKIPLFKIAPWIYDRIAEWKKVRTLQIIANTSKSTGWIGKTIHWAAKNYELGGYTSRGATAHFASTQWGKVVKWGLVKTGMGSVLKYSSRYGTIKVANAGLRTATRLLLKIGGKALARLGSKAIAALLVSVTGILSVIFAVGMVFDLVSMAWTFVKEFIRNSEFRKTIMGWGAAIGAVFATINLGGVFLVLGTIVAASFQFLVIGFFIVMAALLIIPQIENSARGGMRLDSNTTEMSGVVSVVCDLTGSSEANSIANAALCIYQALSECELNPLFESGLSSPDWQCVTDALTPFPGAADQLEISQFSDGWTSEKHLQCVGLAAASVGSGFPQHDACTYATATDLPSGYTYLDGCPNMQSGDLFVMGVDGCSSDAVGHIGVVIDPDQGEKFTCVDANATAAGLVRSDTECYYAKSLISGCLRKK